MAQEARGQRQTHMGALGTIAPFDKDRPRQRPRQRPRLRPRLRPRQRQRQLYLAQLAQEARGQRQTHRGAPEDNCSICLLSLFWKFLHNPLQRLAQEARGQSADPHVNTRERFLHLSKTKTRTKTKTKTIGTNYKRIHRHHFREY